MHRVDSDGYVMEGVNRRFIDQALPGTPGTVDGAEWNNAVQEELLGVLAAAGITPAASSAADRAGGWSQLAQAIFQSGAIGTNALANFAVTTAKIANGSVTGAKIDVNSVGNTQITDLDLGKCFGNIDQLELQSGALYAEWFAGVNQTYHKKELTTGGDYQILDLRWDRDYSGLAAAGGVLKDYVRRDPFGLTFMTGGPADQHTTTHVAHQVWDLSGNTWTNTGNGRVTGVASRILKTKKIIAAYVSIKMAQGPAYDGPSYLFENTDIVRDPTGAAILPNAYRIQFNRVAASSYWDVQLFTSRAIGGGSFTSAELHVIYCD